MDFVKHIADLKAELEATKARTEELQRELWAAERAQREADLKTKIEKLPADVRELLRHPEPRAEDMKRLSPRGLAYARESGGRFNYTERRWTRDGDDIRRLLGFA